ncbi:MAG: Holliday junction branch migration protein RuvA [Proteobacteria bacterium]|nr:Holliday junction branch migration protein RuvA [Pseudomonadota bacterium]
MISHLRGRLVAIDTTGLGCVIDVGGVGYACQASRHCLMEIGQVGEEVEVLVDTAISLGDKRGGGIILTAFAGATQKRMWQLLQSVQGVGGKAALAILSALTTDELLLAITAQDKGMITRADGVGGKLAQRIIHELADKIGDYEMAAGGVGSGVGVGAGTGASEGGVMGDAISALVNLGYTRAEAHATITRIMAEVGDKDVSVESLVSAALAYFGGSHDPKQSPRHDSKHNKSGGKP